MFSSKEYLQKKTGPWGIGRFSYLQSLVTEFQDTSSEESKEQVLANLANFAYDPINYDFMRKLNVWDLFLDCLTESNPKLVEFAIGGICNCSLDKDNRDHILKNDGVKLVVGCLSSDNEETVLSAITCLMFLFTQESREEVASLPVVECMLRFSKSANPRLGNLATVFLQEYCSGDQIQAAMQFQEHLQQQQHSHHPT
ncbi:armadillo repeat-containing protein 7 [Lingula anatina]|uniref:Armadillo repeat-containing protein 7 n=1 Tax=Lingula anatina TaxID=7574 RepID=A0A1S3HB09_LINAN|nr:armadillo repeat-containing protein 7 [Lingula anatina]|eukprot:XP_013383227.1 armadillo repeat-containing protein 7 [Lingula anatina]